MDTEEAVLQAEAAKLYPGDKRVYRAFFTLQRNQRILVVVQIETRAYLIIETGKLAWDHMPIYGMNTLAQHIWKKRWHTATIQYHGCDPRVRKALRKGLNAAMESDPKPQPIIVSWSP
jgi:hypothetical protein